MRISRSKVTSQGQISIPAEIRRRLGIGPGSMLEWLEEDDKVILRRSGIFSSEDIHAKLFPQGPPKPQSLKDLKEGRLRSVRTRYARH